MAMANSILFQELKIGRSMAGIMHSTIKGNYSEHNIRYGLHFMYSNDDTYLSNTFFSNGAGVAVMYSHGVHMLRNNFRENWGDAAYGLLLKEISDSYIKGNQFNKFTRKVFKLYCK